MKEDEQTDLANLDKNRDFMVGRICNIALTIPNGASWRIRDLVVLGKLTIESSDQTGNLPRGKIIARNIIVIGSLDLRYIESNCVEMYVAGIYTSIRESLQNRFLEGLAIQRELVNRIGLRSILAPAVDDHPLFSELLDAGEKGGIDRKDISS